VTTKVRWFAIACIFGGIVLVLASPSDGDFQRLIGYMLMMAGALAAVLSIGVRWDAAGDEIPRAAFPVKCPRGPKCTTGWDAKTSECVLKETTAAIPPWAQDSVDLSIMLDLQTRGMMQLGVEFETYECPLCSTKVLFLVHHGEPIEGRSRIAVKTGPGIYDL
jgi:hypothetical protein